MSEEKKSYAPNGNHNWNENDTYISMYFYKLRMKYSSIEDGKFLVDDVKVDTQLSQEIGMTTQQLAEEIIGCTENALIVFTLVNDFLITGRSSGKEHPNKYQIELSKTLANISSDEMLSKVDDIITSIENDSNRINENKECFALRIEAKEKNIKRKEFKTKENLKKEELKRDLSKNNIKNGKSLSDIKDIVININTVINHPKFGQGVVVGVNEKISSVDFSGDIKKLANVFIEKFIS